MPYVASSGIYVPCGTGVRPMAEVHDSYAGNALIGYEGVGFAEGLRGLQTHRIGRHNCRRGDLRGAQINLVHNCFRSAGVSAVTIAGGATYGAG
jgi:hypothetical protein